MNFGHFFADALFDMGVVLFVEFLEQLDELLSPRNVLVFILFSDFSDLVPNPVDFLFAIVEID